MAWLTNAIRSIVFNLTFYPFTVLYCGLILMPMCLGKTDRTARLGILGYCNGSLWLARWVMGIKFEYRGRDKLPKEGAFIFAAAHQSNMDPMLTFPLKTNLTALAKKQLFSVPFIGTALRKIGIVKVDRESHTAHKAMDKVAEHVVALGRPLIVYPQATRVRPGHYRKLKSGAYYLQADTGLPVYTVATNTGLFWTKGFWHRAGTAIYEIDGPIEPGLDKADFMTAMEDAVVGRSDQLIAEAGFARLLSKPSAPAEK